MKYVFVDTDNGTATPGTAVHTSSAWPSSSNTFQKLSQALGNSTVRAETDDLTIFCRGVAAESTTGEVTVPSAMTCASLLIEGNANTGVWSTSHYRIIKTGSVDSGALEFTNSAQTVTVRSLQIKTESTNATNQYAVRKASGTGTVVIDRCFCWSGGSGAATRAAGFQTATTGTTINVYNSIFRVTNTSATNLVGLIKSNATLNVYNSVADCGSVGTGIERATSVNCAVRATTAFNLPVSTSYCASAAGTGTNAVTVSNWADQWVDGDAGDYRLKSGSSLIGAGLDDPASGAFSGDITGATRSDWDIGAFEWVPTGLSITSVTPSAFDDGRTGIVIAGSGFGASQGSSTLTIGGQAQTVTAWSDTSITFTSVRGSNSMGTRSLTITKG